MSRYDLNLASSSVSEILSSELMKYSVMEKLKQLIEMKNDIFYIYRLLEIMLERLQTTELDRKLI